MFCYYQIHNCFAWNSQRYVSFYHFVICFIKINYTIIVTKYYQFIIEMKTVAAKFHDRSDSLNFTYRFKNKLILYLKYLTLNFLVIVYILYNGHYLGSDVHTWRFLNVYRAHYRTGACSSCSKRVLIYLCQLWIVWHSYFCIRIIVRNSSLHCVSLNVNLSQITPDIPCATYVCMTHRSNRSKLFDVSYWSRLNSVWEQTSASTAGDWALTSLTTDRQEEYTINIRNHFVVYN